MSASDNDLFDELALKVAFLQATPEEKAKLDAILAEQPSRRAEYEEVKLDVAFARQVLPEIYLEHTELPPMDESHWEKFQKYLVEVLGPPQPAVTQTELTPKQMSALILKILSERSMDGVDLTRALDRAGFRLKGEGEGLIYGILARLESSREIEGRWRESSSRMIKTYHITDAGSGVLRREQKATSQLNAWAQTILSTGNFGA